MARKTGLGRGLAALIPEGAPPDERIPVSEVEINLVVPNPHQPRTSIDTADLETLTASVKEHGIIQPLLVSETPDGATGYTLVAGERRLRAARAAGLARVPVTIRQSTPQELLELALIENVQRLDLSALEEAAAYRGLIDQFALTQQQVADRVGRSRTAIANTLRLLELSENEQASLSAGELSEGHARALLGIDDPAQRRTAWRDAIARGLNVRQTEALVRRWRKAQATEAASTPRSRVDPETDALAESLRRSLGTKVTLQRTKRGNGSMTIHFYSDEELEGLLERLTPEGL
ncbi:MAG TPA: ParB/RepB/Spo0J family partition protein [Dehalococcoidia bacterium]|nr:ParB/RepB/Spo0J family partition protein [Dehalococcoidia bacterium]